MSVFGRDGQCSDVPVPVGALAFGFAYDCGCIKDGERDGRELDVP